MKVKETIVGFFCFLCLVTNIFSTNYYIDATNGSDKNSGTSQFSPWQTLHKINSSWNRFLPGDSLLFKRDEIWSLPRAARALIYIPPNTLHGTIEQPIVFGAYGIGEKPIISVANSNTNRAVYATDLSHITFQDLEFRGNVWFYATQIHSSQIHHIKLLRITMDCTNTGGYLDFYAAAKELAPDNWEQAEMHHIEIGYSIFRNVSGSGVQIYGSGNNYVHHNKIYGAGRSGINFAEGDSNRVEYNIISGANGPGIKHSAHSHSSEGALIRGNLILDPSYSGMALYNLINSEIYHNTVRTDGVETAIIGWTTQKPILHCSAGETGFDNNIFSNNIFYGGPFYIWNARGVTLYYKDKTEIKYTQPNIWEDNLFNNNLIYNPNDDRQIYIRNFTESIDLVIENVGNFDGGVNQFTAYDSNRVGISTESELNPNSILRIKSNGHSGGAFMFLNPYVSLLGELDIGRKYVLTFDAKSDSAKGRIALSGGELEPIHTDILSDNWEKYEIEFTAAHYENHFVRCSGMIKDESIYLDNICLYEKENYPVKDEKDFSGGRRLDVYYDELLLYYDYYIRTNQFSERWLGFENILGDLNTDPLFIDDQWYGAEDFGDFCLSESSPGYQYGIHIDDYFYDLYGNPIPTLESPDIGALQTPCLNIIMSKSRGMTLDRILNSDSILQDSTELHGNPESEFQLYPNYPNPFNPSTIISYTLPNESHIEIFIYNLLGELVEKLFEGFKEKGTYNINWKSGKLANGVYILVFRAFPNDGSQNFKATRKMMILN